MGLPSATLKVGDYIYCLGDFQFPLFGITFCNRSSKHGMSSGYDLSIPSIWDYLLQPQSSWSWGLVMPSFNSLYLGLPSATGSCLQVLRIGCAFNSLYLGLPSATSSPMKSRKAAMNFQFPLFGITFCNRRTTSRMCRRDPLSIPSIWDYLLQPYQLYLLEDAQDVFQFPLFGITFCNLAAYVLGNCTAKSFQFPLFGITFCNVEYVSSANNYFESFQFPLFGITFCNLNEFDGLEDFYQVFQFPLFGITFCNTPSLGTAS